LKKVEDIINRLEESRRYTRLSTFDNINLKHELK